MPREPLEAIMLVGGKGTRLRPLTLSAPKPLLPTAGVPFLAHQLARAAECGITHVVLATHTSMRSQIASNATDTPQPAPFDTFDLPPISAASFNGKAAFCQTSIPTRSILLIRSEEHTS